MRLSAVCAAALLAAAPVAAFAGTTVTVSAIDSIWLAGQAAGASVSGYFGTDKIPGNGPVLLNLTSGPITFSATGSTSVDRSCFAGPDGGCYGDQSSFSPSPWGGEYNGPSDALIGIFLGPSAPTLGTSGGYQGPTDYVAGPDYQNPANLGPGSYSPALNQIFIIGDGGGETFTAPSGATRLYLAVADSIGGSTRNEGSLIVNFTGAANVPEPSTWAMLLTGFLGMGAMTRSARRRQAIV